MKTLSFAFAIVAVMLLGATPALCQVNGTLEVVDGKPVLTVWGTHAERGYAQGYLQGEEGKEIFEDYIVGYICSGSSFIYAYVRSHFLGNYTVDAKYVDEAVAMIQGMADAGVSLYTSALGRNVDATDLLLSNAIVDLSTLTLAGTFGCSSTSSWGASTIADPLLAGHLVITRQLDWSKHPTLTDNPLLVVHLPAESDEQPWISIGYAGLFGTLSGVSKSGVSAFLNMGNYDFGASGSPFHPILLSVRNGMESADYDGDGEHTPSDVVAAIEDRSRSVGTIVHSTADGVAGPSPVIIESNNENGVAVRTQTHNTMIPGDNLVATNHFRVLYPPVYCYRYEAIADSLTANAGLSCARSWSFMAGAAGQFGSNVQCIQYVESEGILRWAMDTYSGPAYDQRWTEFDVAELFDSPMGIEEQPARLVLEQNYPNPFNPTTRIRFTLPTPGRVRLAVHDVSGRLVAVVDDGHRDAGPHEIPWDGRDGTGRQVASGVYFCRLECEGEVHSKAMVLLK
jgi:hypothetical protein